MSSLQNQQMGGMVAAKTDAPYLTTDAEVDHLIRWWDWNWQVLLPTGTWGRWRAIWFEVCKCACSCFGISCYKDVWGLNPGTMGEAPLLNFSNACLSSLSSPPGKVSLGKSQMQAHACYLGGLCLCSSLSQLVLTPRNNFQFLEVGAEDSLKLRIQGSLNLT